MPLVLYRSSDGRVATEEYMKYGKKVFCLAEKTPSGVLLTEFDHSKQVISQEYSKAEDAVEAIKTYLKVSQVEVRNVGTYGMIEAKSECTGCGAVGLVRELDAASPARIEKVPVIPIFLCKKCGRKHYSLTDMYLKSLVKGNRNLFDDKELGEIDADVDASVASMQEYILRIFASKKISRMK
jgi:hypothetical protein